VQGGIGGLSLIGGVGALASGTVFAPTGLGFLQVLAPVLPVAMIGIGAVQLVMAIGLLRGLKWAWTLAVGFELVHTLADVGFVMDRSFALDKLVGLSIILASLAYLLRPSVRDYFEGL
jgi:hypothetical protein